MHGYPRVQICEPTMWHRVLFDFWLLILFVLSLGRHTDTYRTVVYDDGAFELCLPSLGNLYQNRMLWCENIHRTPKTNRVWGPGLVGHLGIW